MPPPSQLTDQLRAALAGRYDIEREIGAGGMATVYLARDPRHDRRVALKVLNPELGAVLGVERFLAEIKVTANLQHPNLLPLFDSGETSGLLFYVMPFVEGESLRTRLTREKQLPIDEAVRIATAVASALDYAHRHGVVHRDLKPENILLHDGQPVVADFGIALAVSNAGGGRITQTGLSLGTPQYMSPEQATGDRNIDGRTDIYSLAAVLYEMIGGEPPHFAATAQAIIAKLMTEEVRPLTVLRRTVPPHVDDAVRRALQKLPADRFPSASQFAEALTTVHSVTVTTGATPAVVRRNILPWAVAGVAVVVAVASLINAARRFEPPVVAQPTLFTLSIKSSVAIDPSRTTMAFSPDGSRLVYWGVATGAPLLYSRMLDEDEIRPIPGTEGGRFPFFSPDGTWIGFNSIDGYIKKIPASGGPSSIIAKGQAGCGATWGSNGVIVFGNGAGGLWQVPASGGEPKPLAPLDSAHGETGQCAPSFLPDGKSLLLVRIYNYTARRIGLATLDGKVTDLRVNGVTAMFIAPSYLLYVTQEGIAAVAPFDLSKRQVTGAAVGALDRIFLRNGLAPLLAASPNGASVALLRGLPKVRFGTLTANGELQTLPGDAGIYRHPRVSPDGTRIAVAAGSSGAADLWIYDVKTAGLTRLTFDGISNDPIWSRDGKRIVFSRTDTGQALTDIYSVASDGSEPPKLLLGGPGYQWPSLYMPDGASLIFDERPAGSPLMHVSRLWPDGRRQELVGGPTMYRLPAVSSDGKWLAYTSNETGRVETFVRPLAETGGRWQVSSNGGTTPIFSPDGKTLYYRTPTHLVAATYTGGPAFTVTSRRDVIDDERIASENTIDMDVFPDGKRFAVLIPVNEGSQLVVVANWIEEIKRKLRAGQGAPR